MLFLHTKNLETKRCLTVGYVLWFCITFCAKNSNFLIQNPSWEANILSLVKNSLHCMGKPVSLLCLQQHTSGRYSEPDESIPRHSLDHFKCVYIAPSTSRFSKRSLSFTRNLYAFLFSPVFVTWTRCKERQRRNNMHNDTRLNLITLTLVKDREFLNLQKSYKFLLKHLFM
jgi:hypothetical protein